MIRVYPLGARGCWEAPFGLHSFTRSFRAPQSPRERVRGMGNGKFEETGWSVGELHTGAPGLPQDYRCYIAHRAPRRPRAPGHWRPGTPKTHAVGEGHAPG